MTAQDGNSFTDYIRSFFFFCFLFFFWGTLTFKKVLFGNWPVSMYVDNGVYVRQREEYLALYILKTNIEKKNLYTR